MEKIGFFLVLFLTIICWSLSGHGAGLIYSTYLGGTDSDEGLGNAVNIQRETAYITGATSSPGFPTTPGSYSGKYDGSGDVFVTQLSNDGTTIVYSTFLGGWSSEQGESIAVDRDGYAYIMGTTRSSDFPTNRASFGAAGGGDYCVFKLDPTGSTLVYSVLVGGSNLERTGNILLDSLGCVYISGWTMSADYPTVSGCFDTLYHGGRGDICVTKINPDATSLIYSTYVGGADWDEADDSDLDAFGNVYVTGRIQSTDFPTTPKAFDTTHNGGLDAFVFKLNSDASSLLYSTYLGSIGEEKGWGIVADIDGYAYVAGYTSSSEFPTTPGAFDTTHNGHNDGFISKLKEDGSELIYSTFIGGFRDDMIIGIAKDLLNNVYVAGDTYSTDFPITPDAFDTAYNSDIDIFLSKLDATGSALLYSTYIGGSGKDSIRWDCLSSSDTDILYLAGYTDSTDFPVTAGAYDISHNGKLDAFALKLILPVSPTPTPAIDVPVSRFVYLTLILLIIPVFTLSIVFNRINFDLPVSRYGHRDS